MTAKMNIYFLSVCCYLLSGQRRQDKMHIFCRVIADGKNYIFLSVRALILAVGPDKKLYSLSVWHVFLSSSSDRKFFCRPDEWQFSCRRSTDSKSSDPTGKI